MSIQKVAFAGKMCSGKTTSAKQLIALSFAEGKSTLALSLAGPIKDIARELFDSRGKDRPLLIHIGKSMLEWDQDVFLKTMTRRMERMIPALSNDSDVLVTLDDVRFEHEVRYLMEHGWFVILCDCKQSERVRRYEEVYGMALSNEMAAAPSETGLDHLHPSQFDMVLFTDIMEPESIARHIDAFLERKRDGTESQ